MYKNYHKQKDIVIVPKNNDKNNLKSLNKIDIKQKNSSYENIRDIVMEKKKDIEIPTSNNNNYKFKNKIVKF